MLEQIQIVLEVCLVVELIHQNNKLLIMLILQSQGNNSFLGDMLAVFANCAGSSEVTEDYH